MPTLRYPAVDKTIYLIVPAETHVSTYVPDTWLGHRRPWRHSLQILVELEHSQAYVDPQGLEPLRSHVLVRRDMGRAVDPQCFYGRKTATVRVAGLCQEAARPPPGLYGRPIPGE